MNRKSEEGSTFIWAMVLAVLLLGRCAQAGRTWHSDGGRRTLQQEGEQTCEPGFILREIDLSCELCDVRCIDGDCADFSGCSLCEEGFFTSRRDNLYPFKCRLCDVPNCKECEQGIIDGLPPICVQCQQGFYSIDGGLQCIKDPSAAEVLDEEQSDDELAPAPQGAVSVPREVKQCGDRERLGDDGNCYRCNWWCRKRLREAASRSREVISKESTSQKVESSIEDGSEAASSGLDEGDGEFGTSTTTTATNTTTETRTDTSRSPGSSITKATEKSIFGSSSRSSITQTGEETTAGSPDTSSRFETSGGSTSGFSESSGTTQASEDPNSESSQSSSTTQASEEPASESSQSSSTTQASEDPASESSQSSSTTRASEGPTSESSQSSSTTQASEGSASEFSPASNTAETTQRSFADDKIQTIEGTNTDTAETAGGSESAPSSEERQGSTTEFSSTYSGALTTMKSTSKTSYSEASISTYRSTSLSEGAASTGTSVVQEHRSIKQIWQSCPIHDYVAECEVDKECTSCDIACEPGHCFSYVGCIRCAQGYSVVRTAGSITMGCAPCNIANCSYCADGELDISPQKCAVCNVGFDVVPWRGDCQPSGAIEYGYALPPSGGDEDRWEDELDMEWDSWEFP